MERTFPVSEWRFRLTPLMSCIALALCLTDANARIPRMSPRSNVLVVTNCGDSGAGSLRDDLDIAQEGDSISIQQCSRITLNTPVGTLLPVSIYGSGAHENVIDGGGVTTILVGNAPIYLAGLTLENGAGQSPYGGCVTTSSELTLFDVVVSSCHLESQSGFSFTEGGGLSVGNDLTLINSVITGNVVSASEGVARGGGVFVGGTLNSTNSVISDNSVAAAANEAFGGAAYVDHTAYLNDTTIARNQIYGAAGSLGGGVLSVGVLFLEQSTITSNSAYGGYGLGGAGGAFVFDRAQIVGSTVDNNTADRAGGLILTSVNHSLSTVFNSTISGNRAMSQSIGGIQSYSPLTVANSTIAFNTEAVSEGAGISCGTYLELDSSIISNNSGGATPMDIGAVGTVTGSNNLVMQPGVTVLPPDTIHDDPRLMPLADNGGPTQTHAIVGNSPAIDAGSNVFNLKTDQRQQGFSRVIGVAADIGAFEFDADTLLVSGFD
jgi:hypothetical protein